MLPRELTTRNAAACDRDESEQGECDDLAVRTLSNQLREPQSRLRTERF